MMIILSTTHLSDIHSNAIQTYPEECCGAMLGTIEKGEKKVSLLVQIGNESQENRRRRFAVTAQDYMALESLAKSKQKELLGFYHSHPDHPAIPSETDLRFAWPVFSYIILAINDTVPAEIRSFVLDSDHAKFVPEDIVIK